MKPRPECNPLLTFFAILLSSSYVSGQNGTHAKYIIIGGGLAGLSAAKNLATNGETNFKILEGANRIGGRVKDAQFAGKTVQTGAQWIQGGGDDDVIFSLANSVQLVSQQSDYDDVIVLNETGSDVTDDLEDRWDEFDAALDEVYNLTNRLEFEDTHLPDISQSDALSFYGWRPKTGVDFALQYYDMDFTYGQAPETASTRFGFIPSGGGDYLEEVVLDQNAGGLSKIIGALVNEIPDFNAIDPRLHLNAVVENVAYDDDGVTVRTDGTVYTGQYAIITCSLGVLKNEMLTFSPALPEWKRYSIQGSSYITDYPIYLHFPSNFWGGNEYILYGTQRRGLFSLWQNFDKFWSGSNILQLQMAGTEAIRLAKNTDAEIQKEIMVALHAMFGAGIPEPDEILVPRWHTDPLFMGTYSDWSPAFPSSSHDALRAPVGRVYFAGEGYSRDWFGYMQGAILSGQEETDKLMACDGNSALCENYTARMPPLLTPRMPPPTKCTPTNGGASFHVGTTFCTFFYTVVLKYSF